MEFEQIISFVMRSSTGLALMDCAARTGLRFGIRGGVARNLLLERPEYSRDLLDAVDPFSDIDIVVEDSRDGLRLLESVFASVPFARFYRWEVMVRDSVVTWLRNNVHFATDEFVIWIDGKEGNKYGPTVSVSRLTEPDGIVLSSTLGDDELRKRFNNVSLGELVVSYIKLLTILARRENETNNRNIIEGFKRLLLVRAEKQDSISNHTMRRIDLQIAKLFGATVELGRETTDLAILRDLPSGKSIASQLLASVSGLSQSSEAALGVWRSKGKLQFKLVKTEGQPINRVAIGTDIPQFAIRSPRSSGCCPYSDFREGPAVVMWRRPKSYLLPLENSVLLAFEEYEAGVDVESGESEIGGLRSEGLQIPNVLSIRRGLIARLDHAFLGAITGRSVLMQMTVAEVRRCIIHFTQPLELLRTRRKNHMCSCGTES